MKLWHIMIASHALSGFAAFGAGLLVLSPRRAKRHAWGMVVYIAALISLVVFMLGAMASHWSELSQAGQIIFPALTILGLYMIYRANRARKLGAAEANKTSTYMDDVGFTLISLFNGFVIVGALDLGAPAWVVIMGAIAATLGGNKLIETAKKAEIKAQRS